MKYQFSTFRWSASAAYLFGFLLSCDWIHPFIKSGSAFHVIGFLFFLAGNILTSDWISPLSQSGSTALLFWFRLYSWQVSFFLAIEFFLPSCRLPLTFNWFLRLLKLVSFVLSIELNRSDVRFHRSFGPFTTVTLWVSTSLSIRLFPPPGSSKSLFRLNNSPGNLSSCLHPEVRFLKREAIFRLSPKSCTS